MPDAPPARGGEGILEGALSGEGRLVDLTHSLHEDAPVFPGVCPFSRERVADYPAGFRMDVYRMGENAGTHLDAPLHFFPDGASVDALSLRSLIVPAVVLDLSAECAADADHALSLRRLRRWEEEHGVVPEGSLFLLHTGWGARYPEPDRYRNPDALGRLHFPGFGGEAAEWLVREREVAGVGLDTLSLDPGISTAFPAHRAVLGAGRYGVENLANLHLLPPRGAWVLNLPLPVRGGTQAQTRAVALFP